MTQQHSLFKLFRKGAKNQADIAAICAEVAAWVKEANVAPKSVGIEYLEAGKEFFMSIGYAKDEAYGVEFAVIEVGSLESELAVLEAGLGRAASDRTNVICHELTVLGTTLYAVLMLKQ